MPHMFAANMLHGCNNMHIIIMTIMSRIAVTASLSCMAGKAKRGRKRLDAVGIEPTNPDVKP